MKRRGYRQLARRSGEGAEKLLGELEADIMRLVWEEDGAVTVREVLTKLNAARSHPVAYTTVMTVMVRLAEKGLLNRELVGQTYDYRVAQDRDEFLKRTSDRMVEELLTNFGEVAITSFLEVLERVDPERLRKLREYLQVEQHQP